jgi:hypothetical protein
MKKLWIILVFCLALTGCQRGGKVDSEFIGSSDICLRVKGSTVFTYNPLTCQLAFNRRNCEFRVHTDTMSDYYCVTLDAIPSSEDQKIDGSLCWTSSSSILHKDCTFRVEKISTDGCVWLWDRKDKIGAVVKILD